LALGPRFRGEEWLLRFGLAVAFGLFLTVDPANFANAFATLS
jgi:hypothetical protein